MILIAIAEGDNVPGRRFGTRDLDIPLAAFVSDMMTWPAKPVSCIELGTGQVKLARKTFMDD